MRTVRSPTLALPALMSPFSIVLPHLSAPVPFLSLSPSLPPNPSPLLSLFLCLHPSLPLFLSLLSCPSPYPLSHTWAPLLGRPAHGLQCALWGQGLHAGPSGHCRAGAPTPPTIYGAGGTQLAQALLGGHPALGEAEATGLHRFLRPACCAPSFHSVICVGREEGLGLGPNPPPQACTPGTAGWVVGRVKYFPQMAHPHTPSIHLPMAVAAAQCCPSYLGACVGAGFHTLPLHPQEDLLLPLLPSLLETLQAPANPVALALHLLFLRCPVSLPFV